MPGGIALQTMCYYSQPPRAGPDPIQIQEIVVGCIDPFASVGHAPDSTQQMREQRLQMAIRKKPRSTIGRISDNGHGESKPPTLGLAPQGRKPGKQARRELRSAPVSKPSNFLKRASGTQRLS